MSSETTVFPVPAGWADTAWANDGSYRELYRQSIDDPESFWAAHGGRVDWIKPFTQIKDVS